MLDKSQRKLSRREETTLPLPPQSGFSRRLNRNRDVAPIRFFTVENTIESNHTVRVGSAVWPLAGTVVGGRVVNGAPRVVIVGGGFGGLAAAKALKHAPVNVILIDRTNHHLFQPLLYQVATSVLAPGQIASPIRGILRKQQNTTVILGEVTGVNKDLRRVAVNSADREGVEIPYDYLVLATGVRHSYFGHNEFEKFAPGLKGLADAVAIRNKILQAFEQAEAEEDPGRHRELLTFVLVGAGPTGVEMAGAIAVLVRNRLRSEFRRIDPTSTSIVLLDMAPRVLGTFAEPLSQAAKNRLEALGVEVRLGHGADQIDGEGVIVAGERIASKTVIWTAGVAPSPAGKWLGVETDRAWPRADTAGPDRGQASRDSGHVGDTASLVLKTASRCQASRKWQCNKENMREN